MEAKTQAVIERMALFFERDGLPRIAGRVLGYLLLSPESRSLDDLAESLQVSKSSASTDARRLERMGIVERITIPGDRRDYYQIAADLPYRMSALWQERLVGTRDLLREAMETPAAESEIVDRRLWRGTRLMDALATAVEEAESMLRDEDEGRDRKAGQAADVV